LLDVVSVQVDYTTPVTAAAPTYDDDGNMLTDGSYGNRSYTYDGFGRLTAVGGPTQATYTLDGAGNRLAQTVSGLTTSFDLDLRQTNPTILGDGTRRYLPGDPSAGYEQAGIWSSALTDQLGSPNRYISQTGVQSAITRFDPYGAARPGSTISPGIGYGGEWADATGLVNLRARAYDPALERFTSRDGFGGLVPSPQTANRYSYALNGPYRYADPSGRFVNAIYANGPLLLSLGIQTIPGIGDAYSFLTGSIGYDPIAGISLSTGERAMAIASAVVIGGGFHLLSRLGEDVADARRLERAGEDLAGDAPSGLREADGIRPPDSGTRVFNARSSQSAADSVARRIDPLRFSPNTRFGRALYVAERRETAIAELQFRGAQASHVLEFRFDTARARILDLSDPAVARRLVKSARRTTCDPRPLVVPPESPALTRSNTRA
jgi:RHS repeat-associated protein